MTEDLHSDLAPSTAVAAPGSFQGDIGDGLDNPTRYEQIDPAGMRRLIRLLPEHAARAWEHGCALPPLRMPVPGGPSQVVYAGVGGSAAGPAVLAALANVGRGVPARLVADEVLPPLQPRSLVVATSCSGETRETLSAFAAAARAGAQTLVVTTGGALATAARAAGAELVEFRWKAPPRAALAYTLFPTLALLARAGALVLEPGAVERLLDRLAADAQTWNWEVPESHNPAKALARRLVGTTPLLLAPPLLAPAARRWVAQFAENAKQWSAYQLLPEFNHNALVPLVERPEAHRALRIALLDAPAVSPSHRLRLARTQQALERAGIDCERVVVEETDPLAAGVRACYLGDWVSLYLAVLTGVDPTPVASIERFKAEFAG